MSRFEKVTPETPALNVSVNEVLGALRALETSQLSSAQLQAHGPMRPRTTRRSL